MAQRKMFNYTAQTILRKKNGTVDMKTIALLYQGLGYGQKTVPRKSFRIWEFGKIQRNTPRYVDWCGTCYL